MLARILAEFNRVNAPLSVDGLSRRLVIQKSALEGMLQTLVLHGKLEVHDPAVPGEVDGCTKSNCVTCASAGRCLFIGKMPLTYTKVQNTDTQGSRTQR
jgi:hypothetical protein